MRKTSHAPLNTHNIPHPPSSTPPAATTISPSPSPSSSSSSSNLSQSILHEITRWHGRRCPGNHRYTTVAWSPSTNKPRAQYGFCVAENKKKVWKRGNKRLEGGSGVEGQTLAAAALPPFNLMIVFKVASQPRALQHKYHTNLHIEHIWDVKKANIILPIHSQLRHRLFLKVTSRTVAPLLLY